MDKITLAEVLNQLIVLDPETRIIRANETLLDYINDRRVSEAYQKLMK